MTDAPYNPAISDNEPRMVFDADVEWMSSDIGLPPGNKGKRLHMDDVMKRRAGKVHFPPGYIEPAHSHAGWHAICILKGRMCVGGKDLRPGDYFFGWDIPHGPLEYPDGVEAFVVSMGEDMHHHWDMAEYLAYERQWQPETEEGRKGCAEFDKYREQLAKEWKAKQDGN